MHTIIYSYYQVNAYIKISTMTKVLGFFSKHAFIFLYYCMVIIFVISMKMVSKELHRSCVHVLNLIPDCVRKCKTVRGWSDTNLNNSA